MKSLFVVASVMCVMAAGLFAQQDKGDKEIAFQGNVTIPLLNTADNTQGTILPRFGYYLSRRNFFGVEGSGTFAGVTQSAGANLIYRLYLGSRGSKAQPYVGVIPGYTFLALKVQPVAQITPASETAVEKQIAALPVASQTGAATLFSQVESQFAQQNQNLGKITVTSGVPTVSGEFGVKYYMSQKFAFETSFRYVYQDQNKFQNDIVSKSQLWSDIYLTQNGTNIQIGTRQAASQNIPSTSTLSSGSTSSDKFKQNSKIQLLFGFSYIF